MLSAHKTIILPQKGMNMDTCYSIDEPQKYARWKKPDTRVHKLYDSIHMECPE